MKTANAILNLVILIANVYFFFYHFGRIVNDRYDYINLAGIALSLVVVILLIIQREIKKS